MTAPISRPHAGPRASSLSSNALVWGILSIPSMCIFFPAVVAIVQGARSASMARAAGERVPKRAIAAIAVALVSLFLSSAGWHYRYVINRDLSARYADASARASRGTSATTLDVATACALVEQRILEGATPGIVPRFLGEIHCEGNVAQTSTTASLNGVRIIADTKPMTMTACFVRDSKWSVTKVSTDGTCDAPIDPATSASADPSATP